MKISARDKLKGRIVEVKKGATTAHVRIDVNGTIVTASITNEAVDELGLEGRPGGLRHRQGVGRDGRPRLSERWSAERGPLRRGRDRLPARDRRRALSSSAASTRPGPIG